MINNVTPIDTSAEGRGGNTRVDESISQSELWTAAWTGIRRMGVQTRHKGTIGSVSLNQTTWESVKLGMDG